MRRLITCGIAALTLLLGTSTAQATPITVTAADVNSTFTFTAAGTGGNSGISASLSFKVLSYTQVVADNETVVTLDATVKNTSSTDSRLTGYGFNSEPDITSDSSVTDDDPDGVGDVDLDTLSLVANHEVEACIAEDGTSNCDGLQGGLTKGTQDDHILTLYFSGLVASVKLGTANVTNNPNDVEDDGIYFRFQGIAPNDGSLKLWGQPGGGSDPETPLPEPSSLALLGTALAFGARRLRARQRA